MNKKAIMTIMRNPPTPCPIKNFPIALRDLKFDEFDAERYALVISRREFNAVRYVDADRIAVAHWLRDVILPTLNQHAQVVLEVVDD